MHHKVVETEAQAAALPVKSAEEHPAAILKAWHPGERGGAALADVLFGDCNPAGGLPATFCKLVSDLPPFEDCSMTGCTYRYFRGEACTNSGMV